MSSARGAGASIDQTGAPPAWSAPRSATRGPNKPQPLCSLSESTPTTTPRQTPNGLAVDRSPLGPPYGADRSRVKTKRTFHLSTTALHSTTTTGPQSPQPPSVRSPRPALTVCPDAPTDAGLSTSG